MNGVIVKHIDGLPVFAREISGRRMLQAFPLTFGRGRLGISSETSHRLGFYDDVGGGDDMATAVAVLAVWDGEGEPENWMRHPSTGRYRPGGDPRKEYVKR